ncbi:hypothetical protein FLONG3_3160 [Fusarium longipes]|uniref:Uncharacterized protein n=1 Tax=Fusarium longipes TaxID=694270 RepID=A0A395T3B1_9HYPO|nr:hypothetical protein FLONG3_3160 [Fusarium longipes]
MASYYPEGECYFVRKTLNYGGNWSANDTRQFYSHVLIEYYWNGWTATGTQNRSHERSQWRSGIPSGINNPRFGDWDRFWVAESRDKNPEFATTIHSHQNSLNWNECRDLHNGGPRKYILRPIRIHRSDTEWLWIDATVPLRAIYFPVAQQTDQAFPDLCTYVVIDFRHRRNMSITHMSGQHAIRFDATTHAGLGWRDSYTWGFHVPDTIAYLSVPHKLRNPDYRVFASKDRRDDLMVFAFASTKWGGAAINTVGFFREMDLARILSATFGVEVGWRPYEASSFLRNLLISLVDLGLGFIPGVGPILSLAFGIALQLLEDPDSFSHDNILDINQTIMDNLTRSSKKYNKYLAPGFMAKGRKAMVPSSDEERARRQQYGDELNEQLSTELAPNLVIMSLLEQKLLLHGKDSPDDSTEEGEETEAKVETIDEEKVEDIVGDENKEE